MPVEDASPRERGAVFLDERHAHVLLRGGDGRPWAIDEAHRSPDGGWCWARVPFTGSLGSGTKWTVICLSPLTLTPAIRCGPCREHGYIDGGRWRPV